MGQTSHEWWCPFVKSLLSLTLPRQLQGRSGPVGHWLLTAACQTCGLKPAPPHQALAEVQKHIAGAAQGAFYQPCPVLPAPWSLLLGPQQHGQRHTPQRQCVILPDPPPGRAAITQSDTFPPRCPQEGALETEACWELWSKGLVYTHKEATQRKAQRPEAKLKPLIKASSLSPGQVPTLFVPRFPCHPLPRLGVRTGLENMPKVLILCWYTRYQLLSCDLKGVGAHDGLAGPMGHPPHGREHSRKNCLFWNQPIMVVLLPIFVTLGRLLHLSQPQF